VGEKRRAYKVLVENPELRRPRHRWEDSIKTDFVVIRWEGMD
jgi:hypothetical protein